MKKIIIAGMLMLSLSATSLSPIFAHGGKDHSQEKPVTADDKLKTLTKQLSLRKDQQAQVKAILDENVGQGKSEMSPEACMLMDDKIKAALNDKQKAKYEKMCSGQKGEAPGCCMPVSKKSK